MSKISRRDFIKLLGYGAVTLIGAGIYNKQMEDLFSGFASADGNYDAAIVPGNGFGKSRDITERAKQRVDAAVPLYYNKKVKKLLFSGAWASNGNPSEAEAMSRYALDKGGVSSSDILKEEKSHSTVSNIYFSKVDFLEPYNYKTNVFVSDNIHLPRIEMLANKILGPSYSTGYHGFDVQASEKELYDWKQHEKISMFGYKNALRFVNDGDHESAREWLSVIPSLKF